MYLGKRIKALTWPEPSLELANGLSYYSKNNKYAILDNIESELSDEDGIARFTNLKVYTIYIYIYSMWGQCIQDFMLFLYVMEVC